MSDRFQHHLRSAGNGSWAHRRGNTKNQHGNTSTHPLGAISQRGGASNISTRRHLMHNAVSEIPQLQAGVTVQYFDTQGFLREGTVTRTMSIGYAVLPTCGRRTIVPQEKIVGQ